MARKIYEIAEDIEKNWTKVHVCAQPYLYAMHSLETVKGHYGADSAREIVIYFLSNATSFKGEAARALKNELKALLKEK